MPMLLGPPSAVPPPLPPPSHRPPAGLRVWATSFNAPFFEGLRGCWGAYFLAEAWLAGFPVGASATTPHLLFSIPALGQPRSQRQVPASSPPRPPAPSGSSGLSPEALSSWLLKS